MQTSGIVQALAESEYYFPVFDHVFTQVSVLQDLSSHPYVGSGIRLAMSGHCGDPINNVAPIIYELSDSVDWPIGYALHDAVVDMSNAFRYKMVKDIVKLSVDYCIENDRIVDGSGINAFCQYEIDHIDDYNYLQSRGVMDMISGVAYGPDANTRVMTVFGYPLITEDVSSLRNGLQHVDCSVFVGFEIYPNSQVYLVRKDSGV